MTAPFRGIHGGFIRHTWIALLVLVACGPGGNAGLILPAGFIAERFANEAPGAWHLVIAENGDVVVALEGVGDNPGGVRVFRDADGDGVADTVTPSVRALAPTSCSTTASSTSPLVPMSFGIPGRLG